MDYAQIAKNHPKWFNMSTLEKSSTSARELPNQRLG
jgi:hypothetical protein